ncbi:HEPN domain-containing protein [Spirochaetota bacterium]
MPIYPLLTDYSLTTRYPGDYEEIDENEYKDAIDLADMVIDWVKKLLDDKKNG